MECNLVRRNCQFLGASFHGNNFMANEIARIDELFLGHWLSVPGDPHSKPGGGEKIFLFLFWVVISWLPNLELIHDYAKWLIHQLIHCVWLSIRLTNLVAGQEQIEQKTE